MKRSRETRAQISSETAAASAGRLALLIAAEVGVALAALRRSAPRLQPRGGKGEREAEV